MKIIAHCPSCLEQSVKLYPASMDAWVLNRMLGGPVSEGTPQPQMIVCDCGFAGVGYRFDEEEHRRYYRDYMRPGSDYVRERNIGYLAEYYHSPDYIEMRQRACASFIGQHIDFKTITSVLDYGGDTGTMIPAELAHAQRYVYDVEARDLAPGVEIAPSGIQVDLLLNSHTLEHVSDIQSYMQDLIAHTRPGGWIYTEVPLESAQHFGPNYGFHEHINLWTERSLRNLYRKSGIEIWAVGGLMYKHPMTASIAIFGKML